MDELMQIWNLRCNEREAIGQALKSVDTKQERRIEISLLFLFSWIPDLLLSLKRNAFAHSNSDRSPDL